MTVTLFATVILLQFSEGPDQSSIYLFNDQQQCYIDSDLLRQAAWSERKIQFVDNLKNCVEIKMDLPK